MEKAVTRTASVVFGSPSATHPPAIAARPCPFPPELTCPREMTTRTRALPWKAKSRAFPEVLVRAPPPSDSRSPKRVAAVCLSRRSFAETDDCQPQPDFPGDHNQDHAEEQKPSLTLCFGGELARANRFTGSICVQTQPLCSPTVCYFGFPRRYASGQQNPTIPRRLFGHRLPASSIRRSSSCCCSSIRRRLRRSKRRLMRGK
jgi:hypothetical protein